MVILLNSFLLLSFVFLIISYYSSRTVCTSKQTKGMTTESIDVKTDELKQKHEDNTLKTDLQFCTIHAREFLSSHPPLILMVPWLFLLVI